MKKATTQIPASKGKQPAKAPQPQPVKVKAFRVDDYVRWDLPKEEVLQVKQAFDILDTHGIGLIDPHQLREAFLNLGFGSQGKFTFQRICRLQNECPNGVDFELFIHLVTGKTSQDDSRDDVKQIYYAYSPDDQASFGHNQLKKVAHSLGEDIPDEQIENIINKAAINEEGAITFQDFYNIMTHKVYWD